MNEITYFIIALVLALFFLFLLIKLIDKATLRKLKKKFPEGTETKSKPVDRLDDVPLVAQQQIKTNTDELMGKLLENEHYQEYKFD